MAWQRHYAKSQERVCMSVCMCTMCASASEVVGLQVSAIVLIKVDTGQPELTCPNVFKGIILLSL